MILFYLLLLIPLGIIIVWRISAGFKDLLKIAGRWRTDQLKDVFLIKWFLTSSTIIIFVISLGLAIFNVFPAVEFEPDETVGSEIVFLLDISRSMNAQDVSPSRMEKSAGIIRSITERTRGSAKSLVVFKGTGLIVVPVTEDNESIYSYLNSISTEMFSSKGTNIEKGIESALEAFSSSKSKNKYLFIFSDGESLEGNAAKMSARIQSMDIEVVIIGVGKQEGTYIPVDDGVVLDGTGEPVLSVLDEQSLKQLAASFKGSYLNSQSVGSLAEIGKNVYGEKERFKLVKTSRYRIFVLIALAALLINWVTRIFRWKNFF